MTSHSNPPSYNIHVHVNQQLPTRFEHPGLVKLPEISPKMQNANENYSDNRRTWVNTCFASRKEFGSQGFRQTVLQY